MESGIRVQRQDKIAVVTIAREHRKNAFDDELIRTFVGVFDDLNEKEPIPRAVVLQGAGGASFCAGYDVNCIDPDQSLDAPFPDDRFERVILAVEAFGSPVIAALNGDAFGGGLDLALACDLKFAGAGVRLAMTPAKLGLVYSKSGVARFVRKLGPGLTSRLFLTGEALEACEAFELGLIDGVTDRENVAAYALEFASMIARNAPLAVRGTRRTIQAITAGLPPSDGVWPRIEDIRNRALRSDDLKNALKAFAGKKPVTFQGR